MADEDNLAADDGGLLHMVHQGGEGGGAAPGLPTLMRWPSSSTWEHGLDRSIEPRTAVAALTRPPRLRKWRSSTVNQWQRWSLFCSVQS